MSLQAFGNLNRPHNISSSEFVLKLILVRVKSSSDGQSAVPKNLLNSGFGV